MTTIRTLTTYLVCFILIVQSLSSVVPIFTVESQLETAQATTQATAQEQPEAMSTAEPQPEQEQTGEEGNTVSSHQLESEEQPEETTMTSPELPTEEQSELTAEENTVTDQSLAQEQPDSQPPNGGSSTGGCLIATAAFGSELSPQVQFLRNFRDDHILSTVSGSSFMNVFNAWYYSFSPYVANYERTNPWFQQTVKISIYPLLGILQLSEKAYWYMDNEYGSLTAGLVASSLIGSIYLSPFLLLSGRIRKTGLNKKFVVSAVASVILAVLAVFVSMSYANELALMITTSILVLTTIAVSSIFATRGLVYVGKLIQRTKSQFLAIH
jgi:hypothetical protein